VRLLVSFWKAVLKVIVDFVARLIRAEGARLMREYGEGTEKPSVFKVS
jgi:hypothetical protein